MLRVCTSLATFSYCTLLSSCWPALHLNLLVYFLVVDRGLPEDEQ